MKDVQGYLDRMKGSMEEKLFFLNELDLTNKVIIDFGCADGTMIKHLMEVYPLNCYIGVECNPAFKPALRELAFQHHGFSAVGSLDQLKMILEFSLYKGKELVFICSSVLHELTWSKQREVINFAMHYCNYLIVRDMYYDQFPDSQLTLFGELRALEQFIMLSPRPDLLQDYFIEADKNSKSLDEKIKEYLLKYTYVDNWETEVQEDYFHVDWNYIFSHEHIIYQRIYTNQFIKQRVYEDFNITITWPTHCQVIIQIAKER